MSLPKKKSRPITVAGIRYRYKIRGEAEHNALVVGAAEEKGQMLDVHVFHKRKDLGGAFAPLKDAEIEPVYPKTVAEIILAALKAGWTPTAPATPCQFDWIHDSLQPR